MAELRLTERAREDLAALPEQIREAVFNALLAIEEEPEEAGKALLGTLRGLWSARVGNYRVLYTIEATGVIVRAIRHRAVAYPSHRRA